MNIGLDAGGVIFIHDRQSVQKGDTSQTEKFMPGCIEYVEKLAQDGHKIFVNSFAGRARGESTRKAISEHMGKWIPDSNVFIVGDRNKKWTVCSEQKLDVMVDDRYDVLQTIEQNFRAAKLPCPILIWFSEEQRKSKYRQVVSWEQFYNGLKK